MKNKRFKFRYALASFLIFFLLIVTAIGAGQENHIYREDLILIIVLAFGAYVSAFLDGALNERNRMISEIEEGKKDE